MADVTFKFRIVLNSQGSISGPALIEQLEDGINDIGALAAESNNQSSEAERLANQAVETANNAQSTANNATATAESAIEQVGTLGTVVDSWNARITQAVTASQSAVQTAGEANTKSDTAVSTANTALSQSQTAVKTAQQAVLDTSAAEERINAAAQQVATDKANVQQNAAESATNAGNAATSAQLAEKWATWLGDPEEPENPDKTVDGTDYSAKWWAQHAEEVVSDTVHISAQTLTPEQQAQVWTNIGLGDASETAKGTIQIATNSEAQTGTNDTKAISPLKAFKNFVSLNVQSLSESVQTQVLTNLGVINALEELITENGGTVPTSLSENSVQTMSAEPEDPWADLE